jgi:hypothetical protein
LFERSRELDAGVVARVGRQVGWIVELGRVHEDARDHGTPATRLAALEAQTLTGKWRQEENRAST